MAGRKGRTGRHQNRSNQWLKGTFVKARTDEVFAFKPRLDIVAAIKADMEQRQFSKTEWLDLVVQSYFGVDDSEEE